MEPPSIQKYRVPRARLTKNNRREINEYGLEVPSKNSKNYGPNINEHAMLFNSGTLGTKAFNYRNNSKKKRNNARKNYMEQRAKLAALPPVTPKKNNNTKKNKNNNGTRRALF
jgi:hypothetical protein